MRVCKVRFGAYAVFTFPAVSGRHHRHGAVRFASGADVPAEERHLEVLQVGPVNLPIVRLTDSIASVAFVGAGSLQRG